MGKKPVHFLKIKLFLPGIVASGGRFLIAPGRYNSSSATKEYMALNLEGKKKILICESQKYLCQINRTCQDNTFAHLPCCLIQIQTLSLPKTSVRSDISFSFFSSLVFYPIHKYCRKNEKQNPEFILTRIEDLH